MFSQIHKPFYNSSKIKYVCQEQQQRRAVHLPNPVLQNQNLTVQKAVLQDHQVQLQDQVQEVAAQEAVRQRPGTVVLQKK
jgi:hypothetical protein